VAEQPDWYDEGKTLHVTYAEGYSGHVQDLGDGTCRFLNAPMLGEDGPEWGDRVDLFHNPCAPFERPRVGFRIYPEGVEPTGRSFGVRREPDEEELEEHERLEKIREKRECELIERNYAALNAPFEIAEAKRKTADEVLRYLELSGWVKKQGLEIPDDLHEKKREPEKEPTLEERRSTKLFLLAMAARQYADIEISDEEIQAEADKLRREDEQSKAIVEAFNSETQQ